MEIPVSSVPGEFEEHTNAVTGIRIYKSTHTHMPPPAHNGPRSDPARQRPPPPLASAFRALSPPAYLPCARPTGHRPPRHRFWYEPNTTMNVITLAITVTEQRNCAREDGHKWLYNFSIIFSCAAIQSSRYHHHRSPTASSVVGVRVNLMVRVRVTVIIRPLNLLQSQDTRS